MREKGTDKYKNAHIQEYTTMASQRAVMRVQVSFVISELPLRPKPKLIQAVAIEFSRRREQEPSASRTFVRPIVLDNKRARQSRGQLVRIQSVLCEVACEQNGRGLKCFAL